MIDELVKLADYLDARGLSKESEFVDGIIKKIAGNPVAAPDQPGCEDTRLQYSIKRWYLLDLVNQMKPYLEHTESVQAEMGALYAQVKECSFPGNKRFLTRGEIRKIKEPGDGG
jgi:hypothetical protein